MGLLYKEGIVYEIRFHFKWSNSSPVGGWVITLV